MGVVGGPDPIVDNGLIVYYDPGNPKSFNVGVGSSDIVTDLMSNDNATSYGTVSASFGDRNGFNTNATGNYIQIAGSSNGPLYDRGTGDFAVEAWGANVSSGNWQWLMSNWNTNGIHMGVMSSNMFGAYVGSDSSNSSFEVPADGTWHHYVLYRDGTTVYFYVDGESKGSFTSNKTLASTTNTRMGSRGNSTAEIWKGTIGPTKIYNRALTAAEVLQNYNAIKGRFE